MQRDTCYQKRKGRHIPLDFLAEFSSSVPLPKRRSTLYEQHKQPGEFNRGTCSMKSFRKPKSNTLEIDLTSNSVTHSSKLVPSSLTTISDGVVRIMSEAKSTFDTTSQSHENLSRLYGFVNTELSQLHAGPEQKHKYQPGTFDDCDLGFESTSMNFESFNRNDEESSSTATGSSSLAPVQVFELQQKESSNVTLLNVSSSVADRHKFEACTSGVSGSSTRTECDLRFSGSTQKCKQEYKSSSITSEAPSEKCTISLICPKESKHKDSVSQVFGLNKSSKPKNIINRNSADVPSLSKSGFSFLVPNEDTCSLTRAQVILEEPSVPSQLRYTDKQSKLEYIKFSEDPSVKVTDVLKQHGVQPKIQLVIYSSPQNEVPVPLAFNGKTACKRA